VTEWIRIHACSFFKKMEKGEAEKEQAKEQKTENGRVEKR
jgi:hypothetical protein